MYSRFMTHKMKFQAFFFCHVLYYGSLVNQLLVLLEEEISISIQYRDADYLFQPNFAPAHVPKLPDWA